MHSFVNKLRLGVNLSMIWRWTQLCKNISSLRTTQDSQFRGWPGNEFDFDKSATHWELLKTQENVDDWDLESSLRDQQLIDHHSRLKIMSMIGTWAHLWEISSCLMTPPASGHLPTDCGRHLANPLPWHWHEHPAWTSTCMGKGNTVAFMRNTCGLLWQLGKHLVSQCQQIAYSWRPGRNLWKLIQAKHDQSLLSKFKKCLTAVGIFY